MHRDSFFGKSRPPFKIIGWMAVAVLALWGLALAIALGSVVSGVLDAKEAMTTANRAIDAWRFDVAGEQLRLAKGYVHRTQKGFKVLNTVRWIPWLGKQVEAANALASASSPALEAAGELIAIGADVMRLSGFTPDELETLNFSFKDIPSETKLVVLRRLSASSDALRLASAKLDLAAGELAGAPRDGLDSRLRALVVRSEEALLEGRDLLELLSTGVRLTNEFAGLGEAHEFLLLFLNNAELRPGGGFIGAYGELSMLNGDIQTLETHDVYALDDAAAPFVTEVPPEPLRRYNAASKWFFRDANWSPDFSMSAKKVLEFYQAENAAIGNSMSARGVIGFTPTFASSLLQITGPLTVRGQTFTNANVFDKLEYQVEYGYAGDGVPLAQRKEILGDLVNATKDKLYTLPALQWRQVLVALEDALRNKQLALYSTNADVIRLLSVAGWDGSVPSQQTVDTIMVVDANLASLKTDPAVFREIFYEVYPGPAGKLMGRVRVLYNHQGVFDWKTTRYRTYTRLLVPHGSILTRVQGARRDDILKDVEAGEGTVDVIDELGFTSFGAFLPVEPGSTGELLFEFELAPTVTAAIETGHYDLSVIKQMGAGNHALTLALYFDKKVKQATPPEPASDWGDDMYRLNTILDQDLHFKIGLQ